MSYIPGPWKMQEQGGLTPQGQANIGFEITAPSIPDDDYLVYLDMGTVNTNKPGADEKIAAKVATAQLILAAPDLKDVLLYCVSILSQYQRANQQNTDAEMALHEAGILALSKASAVIAKVENYPNPLS